MTPTQLEQAGAVLFGPRWQTDLARALGVSDRSMRRWANGANPLPDGLRAEILELLRARITEIEKVKAALSAPALEQD